MKINFYYKGKLAFNPYTEKNVGVSSEETIIVNVAQKLADIGHDITAFVNCNFPDIYKDVKYYQYYDYKPSEEDVLICFGGVPKNKTAKKTFLWSSKVEVDLIKQYPEVDKLIVSSEWHRDRYASELDQELVKKMIVIEPGVAEFFYPDEQERWPMSVTFAGAPQKGGMKPLIEFSKRLKPKFPKSAIHAYGGGALLGWDDEQFRPVYDDLIKNRILYHGQKGKKRLSTQFKRSQIFIYPVSKDYQHAFGLTVAEAMAAGCVVICSDSGNLKNLVKDAGYVISGSAFDYKWQIEAVEKVIALFQSPSLTSQLSQKAHSYASQYTWDKTVEKLLELLFMESL